MGEGCMNPAANPFGFSPLNMDVPEEEEARIYAELKRWRLSVMKQRGLYDRLDVGDCKEVLDEASCEPWMPQCSTQEDAEGAKVEGGSPGAKVKLEENIENVSLQGNLSSTNFFYF